VGRIGPVRAEALNLLAAVRLHADSHLGAAGVLRRGLVCMPTAGSRCGSSEGSRTHSRLSRSRALVASACRT
jgi:hypothetical protein